MLFSNKLYKNVEDTGEKIRKYTKAGCFYFS